MAPISRPPGSSLITQGSREWVERMRWVVGLRWTVVVALLLVALYGSAQQGDSRQAAVVYLGLALLVLTYNLIYFSLARWGDFGQAGLAKWVKYAQVPVDLAVITTLVHFRGGYSGPVFVLYFLYVFICLAILPPSGAYWAAALAALFYGLLTVYENVPTFERADVPTLLSYVLIVSATLMMTAYIANYFAKLLTKDEGTIRRQLGEMNTLYSMTRRMAATLNGDDVLRTLLSLATEVANPSSCWLLLFDEQGRGVLGATTGVSAVERQTYAARAPSIHNALIKQMVEDSKGVFAPDVSASPELEPLLTRPSTSSLYALPLSSDGTLNGVLCLGYDEPYTMPDSLMTLLNTVMQQAALALERSRLFTEAERSALEMTSIYHIGLATTSTLQIEDVMRVLYDQINQALHPDTFYIGLYDEEQAALRYDIFIENGEHLPPFRSKLGDGVTGWVVRNRRPVLIRDWDAEIEQLPFEGSSIGAPTKSLISVPLMAINKMVGVMSVQSLRVNAFDHEHLRLLTSIAGQAALALENAQLHAEVHEQAQRDPLTGVYNHGVFIDKLQSIIGSRKAESRKQKAEDSALSTQHSALSNSVALIMLDIDRFKPYNDTYGHMVGDDVLRLIAVSIQDHLKSTDVVGRWGGEEFGIILQDVSREQARVVADRIRNTAATTTLHDLHNRTIPSPTVSQGLAMFDEDADEIEKLIDRADSALYRAKDLGRNQIAEWADMANEPRPIRLRPSG